jgi:hypothetical protein
MSLLGATILTAVATLALAVFALFTVIFAVLAWVKQSRAVSDQAKMLDLQRKQLAAQEKTSAEQAKVLALQAKDLHESIKERERLRKAAERGQADEIGFLMTATRFPDIAEEDGGGDFAVPPGETVHMAIVSNGSRRPITDVRCSLGDESGEDLFPNTYSNLAAIAGRLSAASIPGLEGPHLADQVPRTHIQRIPPGEKYGFVFELNSHRVLTPSHVTTSFTDDAGLRWQIDLNQHLEPLQDKAKSR